MQNSSENEALILKLLSDAQKNYRSTPRQDYLNGLAIALDPLFSPKELKILLDRAAKEFDQYPSLSQLIKLGLEINVRDLANPRPQQASTAPLPYNHTSQTPWPTAIEGLMLVMAQNMKTGSEKGFKFAIKMLDINENDAWKLYDAYVEQKYTDPACVEIIRKSRSKDCFVRTKDAMQGKVSEGGRWNEIADVRYSE